MPFLITDLGNHDAILSRKWLAHLDLWLDVRNRRLIWPADLPPTPSFVKETTVNIKTLHNPTINLAHQANAFCRNQAFQENLQTGNVQVLRRTTQLSTVEPTRSKLWTPASKTIYTGRTDWRDGLRKMERELRKGPKVQNRPKTTTERRKQPKNLPHVDIYYISLAGFH